MLITEELIAEWVDGKSDPATAAEIERLCATDAAVAAQAERIRKLHSLVRAAVPLEEPSDELLARLGLSSPAGANVVRFAGPRRRDLAAGRRWSIGGMDFRAMAAGIAVVLIVGAISGPTISNLGAGAGNSPYQTLGDKTSEPPANAVIIFASGLDRRQAGRIADGVGARLIGSPNDAGAWKLRLPEGNKNRAIARLRQDPGVALVEPLEEIDG